MKSYKLTTILSSLIALLFVIISCQKRDFKTVAKVETKAITDTMATTATATGEIIDLGEGITNYGHCWSLSMNPTIADLRDSLGVVTKTGIFTSRLKNLEPGKTYHIKAYAKSGGNIFYGANNLSFTTPGNPLYISSAIGDATPSILEMTYNLTLANILPDTSAFGVMVNNVARPVSSVAISGTNVQLTLSSAFVYGDVVTVAYTKPASNPIQTASGGQAASITAQTVTNNVKPVIPTYVSSVIVNATPALLTMTYNLTLANVVPAGSSFTVMVNNVARSVSGVAISGTNVQLTLASAVVYGDVVTVAYTKPASNPLQTSSGGQAASITAQTVTNNVNPAIPTYVSSAIANATPTLLTMTYNLTLANVLPAGSSFTVMVNNIARSVSSVAISGTNVQLTLSSAVVYEDVVTVAYIKPASNPLQTASGGQAASITAQTVTNNVNSVIPIYVSSVIVDATPALLTMTYNLTLANVIPDGSTFTVKVNNVARTVNSVAISGTNVQLTLASAVVYGDVVTVAYTKPASNPLQTASGGQVASITAQSVTNNVSQLPVYLSSAIVNATPALLTMTYNLTLANVVPASSAFTVMVNNVARSVSGVAISGTNVQLTLANPVVYGDAVTVAYTKPASNPLQTSSGRQAASITAQTVTNNVNPAIPTYVSSAIANATPTLLTMTYNLTLANVVPAGSSFTVMVNNVARSVSGVAISGTNVQLTLASPIVYGDVVTVAYTKPASNPLQTASGGQAASITAQTVTNNVNPSIPIYVSSAIANATPTLLTMTYNLTLANVVPASSSFTVMVNNVARTVSGVAISGTNVQLTLASAVVYGDIVTVAYTKPASNPIQTASGGQAVSITAQTVTNNVSQLPVYLSSVIVNATPALLTMTYNLTLANVVPAGSAFMVMVNNVAITVSGIAISGTNVQLTLASPVVYGDVMTIAYTKPASNPLQTASGGQAVSITAQTVTNNVTTIVDRDDNTYNTVIIGTQVWMAENLKTTKYNDGTAIPDITVDATWAAATTGAYCDYSNNPANSTTYGRLYNWYVVDNNAATKVASNGGKNVCPTGWHVPTDAEWTTLTTFLGGESGVGDKLKETGTAHWSCPNAATNETGFTALPGGTDNYYGVVETIGFNGYWWSTTEYSLSAARYRGLYCNYGGIYNNADVKLRGFSVRCLKD